jgi:chitinase
LTQLNLAFAYIDPRSFQIRLQNPQDDDVYREFVELRDHGLEVWLGVGGWEFNDEGPTRTTWSDMASSAGNRMVFIESTLQFLKEYGFQGIDIDWEWPASASRGGRPEDTQNQVS